MNSTQSHSIADTHNSIPESDSTNQASKAHSAHSALDHGICSPGVVIEGRESLDHWIAHREIVVRELCPVGALETAYTQRAALYLWRLARINRYEITATPGDMENGAAINREGSKIDLETLISPAQPALQSIIKYEAHLDRCLARTMTELRRLQKERRQGLRKWDNAFTNQYPGESSDPPVTVGFSAANEESSSTPVTVGFAAANEESSSTPVTAGFAAAKEESSSTPVTAGFAAAKEESFATPIPAGFSAATRQSVVSPAKNQDKFQSESGTPRGSPSRIESRSQNRSHRRRGSPTRMNSPSPARISRITPTPPLLDAISRRNRFLDANAGGMFVRDLSSSTLDITMIPKPMTIA